MKSNSTILWTRIGRDTSVKLEVWSNPQLKGKKAFQKVIQHASADRDFTVKVDATGLLPNTTYSYRFKHDDADGASSSEVGTFQTAPSPGSATDIPRRVWRRSGPDAPAVPPFGVRSSRVAAGGLSRSHLRSGAHTARPGAEGPVSERPVGFEREVEARRERGADPAVPRAAVRPVRGLRGRAQRDWFTAPTPIAVELVTGPVATNTFQTEVLAIVGPAGLAAFNSLLTLDGAICRDLDTNSYGLVEALAGAGTLTLASKDENGAAVINQVAPAIPCAVTDGP